MNYQNHSLFDKARGYIRREYLLFYTELGKLLEVLVLEYGFDRTRTRTRTRRVSTRTRTRRVSTRTGTRGSVLEILDKYSLC